MSRHRLTEKHAREAVLLSHRISCVQPRCSYQNASSRKQWRLRFRLPSARSMCWLVPALVKCPVGEGLRAASSSNCRRGVNYELRVLVTTLQRPDWLDFGPLSIAARDWGVTKWGTTVTRTADADLRKREHGCGLATPLVRLGPGRPLPISTALR